MTTLVLLQVGWQKACEDFFLANVTEGLEDELSPRSAVENLYDMDQMERDSGLALA